MNTFIRILVFRTELPTTDLDLNKLTELRAPASWLYFALIGCNKTRTDSARLVLNTYIPMRLFTVEFAI